jgi:peptidoglycan/LPS O-acetylase OafA/YrhL
MTNDHHRQRLPNRRFRRLLPAAVAAVTLAASAPLGAPPAASAATAPQARIVAPAGKIPTLPRATTTRGGQVQWTSSK